MRPLADGLCLQLVRQQTLTKDHFSQSSTGCLLGKAGRQRYYAAYEESVTTDLSILHQEFGRGSHGQIRKTQLGTAEITGVVRHDGLGGCSHRQFQNVVVGLVGALPFGFRGKDKRSITEVR